MTQNMGGMQTCYLRVLPEVTLEIKTLTSHRALCADIHVYKQLIGFSFGSDEGSWVT